MEIFNYISPIPFYTSQQSVDSMNDYAFGDCYKNVVLLTNNVLNIPPFVVHTSLAENSITTVAMNLCRVGSTSVIPITQNPNIHILRDNGFATILHKGVSVNVGAIPMGKYYLQLYVWSQPLSQQFILYSDYIFLTDDIHNYVKLTWKNANDLFVANRIIPFGEGFEPYCYVDSLIGKPEYSYDEESIVRMGYQFIESQVSKKTYNFVFVAPEYLCDALRIMKICNTKRVTRYDMPNYGKEYNIMSMDFSVRWEEQGNLAGVTISFDVNNIASNISGYLPLQGGDFNNDYDSDFNNF